MTEIDTTFELIETIKQAAYSDAKVGDLGTEELLYTIGDDGNPIIIDRREHNTYPPAKTGTFCFADPVSFGSYVAVHAQDGTQVFADARNGTARALIDGHSKTLPGWGRHVAKMELTMTGAFRRIIRHTKLDQESGPIGQEAFANWLDDISDEIVGQDAAELVKLVDNLHVHSTSTQKEIRATGHGRTITFTEESSVKAGTSSVELPSKIEVVSTVFEGVTSTDETTGEERPRAWKFVIRISVVASPGQPTKFRVTIPRIVDVLDAATAAALQTASALFPGVPVYYGDGGHAASLPGIKLVTVPR